MIWFKYMCTVQRDMTQSIENDVFRFVAIRQPSKITPEKEQIRFAYDVRNDTDSKVLTEIKRTIAKGGNDAQIIDSIKKIITSQGYSLNYPLDAGYQKLDEINKIVQENLNDFNNDDLVKNIEEILGSSISDFVKNEECVKIRDGLWERLYAFHILNRTEPSNLENLVQGLQIIHILDFLANNSSFDDLLQLKNTHNSVPVLPELVFKLPQKKERASVPSTDTSAENVKQSEMTNLWKQFTNIHKTLDEIKSMPIQPKEHFGKEKPKPITSKTSTANSSGVTESRWILNQNAISKLSNETKTTLKELGLEADKISLPQLIDSLENKQRLIATHIFQSPNINLVKNLQKDSIAIPGIKPLIDNLVLMKKPSQNLGVV